MISGNVLKGQKRKMEKVERKKQNKDLWISTILICLNFNIEMKYGFYKIIELS